METNEVTLKNSAGASRTERAASRPTVTPPVDIYENADEILLVADVPGVAPDQVAIELEKNRLTFSARRRASTPDGQGEGFDYVRAFRVPSGIDAARIEAKLVHGVLEVRLPKSAELRPRRIEVRAG